MNVILLKLLLAHIIGDFLLQPDTWVVEKESRKLRSPKFYLHILIHGALILLFLWDFAQWKVAFLLMVLHGVTDALKLSYQGTENKRGWFFADQLVHLASIVGVWYFYFEPGLTFHYLDTDHFWKNALAVTFLTFPSSIVIKILIAKWTPTQLPTSTNIDAGVASLKSAGKYIGIMERLLVFLFASIDHWEAVGFLIAAKSVFRFGDLKEGADLKLTEYILVGTLLSFGIAILVAFGVIST
ncbi:DUF3307 domain-containing protein [Pedobacter sp. SYSU D00535]|uniref:DUF3307 domain-containing protein n=1 Tax=Pedobacter sp. SYSU D00535 TaxID=2810308 RepID=UPI001A95F82A|nr:DUF3307 domain-containing protein [Pedobacter sp. SYSU D00535]